MEYFGFEVIGGGPGLNVAVWKMFGDQYCAGMGRNERRK